MKKNQQQISVREHFAGIAMIELIKTAKDADTTWQSVAETALQIADIMIDRLTSKNNL